MGIPHKTATDFDIEISRIHYDYLLQEVKSRKIVDEIAFAFESDNDDVLRFIGISNSEKEPFRVGVSDRPRS